MEVNANETPPKIKVVHWINITRLFRCHLPFRDTSKVTHYYLVYPLTRWRQMFEKPHMRVGNVRQVLFLENTLRELKPDAVVCTNVIDQDLMKLVRKHCKYFVYVHHAIWSDEIIEKQRQMSDLVERYSIFDRVFCTQKEANMFIEAGLPSSIVYPVKGVIYFDEVLSRDLRASRKFIRSKFEIPESTKKIILFIHNTGFHCRNLDDERKTSLDSSYDYKVILQELLKYAQKNNCFIFSKIKKKSMDLWEDSTIKELHNHPLIEVIRPEKEFNLLSMFLFADAIILQGYGTSYIETLLVNPKIAPCFLNAKSTFDSQKYPNMPVIQTKKEIHPILDDFLLYPKKFTETRYRKEITKIITDQFGGPVENVANVVMKDILKNTKI